MSSGLRGDCRLPTDQPERDAAARHVDVHVLVDAGAGSGKTTQLVSRYMHILENDPAAKKEGAAFVDRIVAITFTNKAAREMKERLRAEFARRRDRAQDVDERRVWRDRIRRLETAPISTIHAFCARLLKQFPFAAGVDPEFQVLDELQTVTLLSNTVRDSLLGGLEEDRPSAALVVSYYEGLEEAAKAIETLIRKREKYREWVSAPPGPCELLERWSQWETEYAEDAVCRLQTDENWDGLLSRLTEASEIAKANRGDALSNHVLEMLELAYALPRLRIHQVKEWIEDLENACKTGNKGASAVWEPVGGPQRVRDLLRCVAKYGDAHFARFKEDASPSRTTAEAASAIWHEAHHALDAWQKLKDAITVLDYDDLQIMLRDLLHNDSDIRARLRRRFRHVLVDEFQDTSSLQQEIVWLLSGVGEGGRDTARVFLVGDAKQSIYRFRNADVTVYNRTRHEFESAAGCEVRRLSVSFRPNAELMAFFNEAFRRGQLLGNEATADYDAWYEPMEAMRQEVPISPAALGLLVASEDEKILYRRAGEARVIARLIRHLLEIRPLVFDHHTNSMRPLHPGHIAILLRATTDVHLYEQQLSEAGIPFYNASGRGFFGQREITDVMNALRVVANPRDSIALVGVLRSPMFSLSDETLFWLGENSRIPWWDRVQEAAGQSAREREPYCFIAADEYSRLVLAARVLSSWREERDRLPLSAIVEKIIEETGYDAAMAGQVGGVRAVANLGKLADLARKFERSGQGGVGAFAEWLTALSASDSEEAQAPTEEEESESVRISSVHGAKGLQWPVVIVADLCRGIGDGAEVSGIRMHPKFGLVPKEPDEVGGQRWRLLGEIIKEQESKEAEAEAKRLLYVAMTRASDLLVLSSSVRLQSGQLKQYGGESWLGRFVSAFNIPTESISAVEHAPQPLESSSPWPWFLVSPTCNEFGSLLQVQMPATATEVSPPGREQAQLFGLEDRAASPIDYSVALRSFPPETSGRRRFAVTEVADYLFCPRFYQLHHVDGLPDALAHEPILSQELSPIERGTVAHRLLQMIGTGGCEELDKLLTSTLPGGGTLRLLPEADQAQLRDLLSWFLSSKFYARHIAAASHLRTEAWISFAHGDALVEGKVDAVAETLEGMVLVDYKTGSGRAVLPDEQEPDMDRFQLALYSYGVRQVLGALPRLGAIVYLADERIDEIDTQAAADEAARRALEAITRIRGGHFPAARVPEKCRRCRLRWACEETL